MDSRIFKGRLQGLNLIGLKGYLYHWKHLGTLMSKMGSHDPFEYLKHKLTHLQLLDGFNSESKSETTKKERSGACSLAHNTLGVEGHARAPK